MEDKPKLLILYATQTGNALDAAERIGREAERRGCPVKLHSMDEYDPVSCFSICISKSRIATSDMISFSFNSMNIVKKDRIWKLYQPEDGKIY